MKKIGKNLKRLMAERKITVASLSIKSGVSQTYLYDILSGEANNEAISIEKLVQIVKALNSTLAEITQEPWFVALNGRRNQLTREQLELVDAILSLKQDDWRRQSILRILGFDHFFPEDNAKLKVDDG